MWSIVNLTFFYKILTIGWSSEASRQNDWQETATSAIGNPSVGWDNHRRVGKLKDWDLKGLLGSVEPTREATVDERGKFFLWQFGTVNVTGGQLCRYLVICSQMMKLTHFIVHKCSLKKRRCSKNTVHRLADWCCLAQSILLATFCLSWWWKLFCNTATPLFIFLNHGIKVRHRPANLSCA